MAIGPIKPKGVTAPVETGTTQATEAATPFRDVFKTERSSDASTVAPLSPDLMARVQAGTVTRAQLVEELVQRRVSGTQGLTDTGRAGLESMLREALSNDPTLQSLLSRIRE